MLYLENSFIPGVFAPERLETLKLLSTQIAYIKKLESYLQDDIGDIDNGDGEAYHCPIVSLTERETEILKLIAAGMSNKEIAERLEMTIKIIY
ncbi:MAG: helix-turn-helix transcriptional regulator [Bacillota bacterium]